MKSNAPLVILALALVFSVWHSAAQIDALRKENERLRSDLDRIAAWTESLRQHATNEPNPTH